MKLRHFVCVTALVSGFTVGCKPAEGDPASSLSAERDKADELAKIAAGSDSHEITVLGKRAAAVRDLIDELNAATSDDEKKALINRIYDKQAWFGSAPGMVADECL